MSKRSVRLPILPPVGACRLTRWAADAGATLEAGELYAEIDSDKAIMELRAPAACSLAERCVDEGASVREGVVVAVLELDEANSPPSDLVPTLHYRYLGPSRS